MCGEPKIYEICPKCGAMLRSDKCTNCAETCENFLKCSLTVEAGLAKMIPGKSCLCCQEKIDVAA